MQSFLYVWKVTGSISVNCPTLPGKSPIIGFISKESVEAAYRLNALAWIVAVVTLVLLCYLTATASLNRGFVMKWWMYWGVAVLFGLLIPLVVLSLAPLKLLTGSCGGLHPFRVHMSFTQIFPSMVAWALWALIAFPLLSWVFTRLAGWHPAGRGFFHYRGCPWPRWNPFAS